MIFQMVIRPLSVENITYEVLLTNILKGTEFTFKKEDNYFVIGNRKYGRVKNDMSLFSWKTDPLRR